MSKSLLFALLLLSSCGKKVYETHNHYTQPEPALILTNECSSDCLLTYTQLKKAYTVYLYAKETHDSYLKEYSKELNTAILYMEAYSNVECQILENGKIKNLTTKKILKDIMSTFQVEIK